MNWSAVCGRGQAERGPRLRTVSASVRGAAHGGSARWLYRRRFANSLPLVTRSNLEQRSSVHRGTLLLGILAMRSSEAHRPHTDTEHMPCYQPTEQRIMIPPTISNLMQ